MANLRKSRGAAEQSERYLTAVDLIAEARQRCLLTQLLVEQVVAFVGQNRFDERLTVLVYAIERSTSETMEAVQRAVAELK